MQWLRRNLITGIVVIVPIAISVAAFIWLFGLIDGVMGPIYSGWLGREIPGLGLLTLAALVVLVGALATNVILGRLLSRGEEWLLRLPLFGTVYATVKQLVTAFSPESQVGFKRVVLVDDPKRGLVLGFLTKEFRLEGDEAPAAAGSQATGDDWDSWTHVAVYVPTNHVYFGDIHIYPRSVVSFPSLTVQEGLQVFLTGGMALGERLRTEREKLGGGGSESSVDP
ncbi:MAG: DUF502 domain-containing protein [Acidobacteria bacterium]|nr:DUF502 domain-containing protein [Acidobacteriota bacterium]MXZ73148.1 DUF502 domain-containing protein [Acidobacteriota bacterium]MYD70161.1 DUF502 domain-containing protein [Acidobacteriota bacterium]MYJ06149.1 DUF502 domain-containing protein [Acidobacteriota bacterium]